jgi:hypothetical protein
MKKFVLSAVAVVFTMFLFSSCGADVEKDIVGEWTIESADLSNLDELVNEMAEQFGLEGEDLEEMKAEMNEGMSDEFIGETIEFVEDKSVKLGGDDEGEWSYDSGSNTITISEGGDEFKLLIDKLSGDNLEVTMSFEDSGMKFDIAMVLSR